MSDSGIQKIMGIIKISGFLKQGICSGLDPQEDEFLKRQVQRATGTLNKNLKQLMTTVIADNNTLSRLVVTLFLLVHGYFALLLIGFKFKNEEKKAILLYGYLHTLISRIYHLLDQCISAWKKTIQSPRNE